MAELTPVFWRRNGSEHYIVRVNDRYLRHGKCGFTWVDSIHQATLFDNKEDAKQIGYSKLHGLKCKVDVLKVRTKFTAIEKGIF